MANVALSGAKTKVFSCNRGTLMTTGSLTPSTWYEVVTFKPTGSVLPISKVSAIFKSPATGGTAIVLTTGDSVYPLTLTYIGKADASVSAEEGTIDVTDDSEEGYIATILDGYANMSGDLSGFIKFDDETGVIETVSASMLGRFFNVVTDDGQGEYTVTPKSNSRLVLFILMNKDAGIGDTQNYMIIPANLKSIKTGAALKDAQKRDMSWDKAQGYVSIYKRVAAAGDVDL